VIVLAPYDPGWARSFEAERALLERVLAPWLESGVEHVGSTAIPGISAKPIVDMVAGVRDLEEARAAYEPLHAVGYLDEPHRPETAHHFAKPALELAVRRSTSTSPSRAAASGASDSPSATRSEPIRASRPSTRR
jgi:GrpB-like predicted nucleotidyltransferase (UPF0157 family)